MSNFEKREAGFLAELIKWFETSRKLLKSMELPFLLLSIDCTGDLSGNTGVELSKIGLKFT